MLKYFLVCCLFFCSFSSFVLLLRDEEKRPKQSSIMSHLFGFGIYFPLSFVTLSISDFSYSSSHANRLWGSLRSFRGDKRDRIDTIHVCVRPRCQTVSLRAIRPFYYYRLSSITIANNTGRISTSLTFRSFFASFIKKEF